MPAIVAGAQTSVTALGDGSWRVQKTAGVEGHFGAWAASAEPITGDFVLRAEDLTPGNNLLFGVSADPGASAGFMDLSYSCQFYGTEFYVYELGVHRPPIRVHEGVAWIARLAGVVSYRTGPDFASALIAREVPADDAPLFFDCSIARAGGAIGVRFEPPGSWAGAARAPRPRIDLTL